MANWSGMKYSQGRDLLVSAWRGAFSLSRHTVIRSNYREALSFEHDDPSHTLCFPQLQIGGWETHSKGV